MAGSTTRALPVTLRSGPSSRWSRHVFTTVMLPSAAGVYSARVVDPATNAKLAVTFQWPFRGDYWIIDLDRDYRWAVVGHPSRDYLWILSRTPRLDGTTYAAIVGRLQQRGYETARLHRTLQP